MVELSLNRISQLLNTDQDSLTTSERIGKAVANLDAQRPHNDSNSQTAKNSKPPMSKELTQFVASVDCVCLDLLAPISDPSSVLHGLTNHCSVSQWLSKCNKTDAMTSGMATPSCVVGKSTPRCTKGQLSSFNGHVLLVGDVLLFSLQAIERGKSN